MSNDGHYLWFGGILGVGQFHTIVATGMYECLLRLQTVCVISLYKN